MGPKSKRKKMDSAAQERQAVAVRPRNPKEMGPIEMESLVHVIDREHRVICDTDRRGYPTPQGRSPLDLVVDASEGFIPLWTAGTVLRWRFRERSMDYFQDPVAAKTEIRSLLAEALLAWGSAAPVTFKHDLDLWDFEIVMRPTDQCNAFGCVLASAFFPDGGRHALELYPKMFTQDRTEQVETFIHEVGHIFGLRHFFADVREGAWPSEIFGRHNKFSIMNYGEFSELTTADKEDLTRLYQSVWSGDLTHINGTPIQLVTSYSALAPVNTVAPSDIPQALRPAARARSTTRAPRDGRSRSKATYLDEKEVRK
jgi:hypothetical protein